MALRKSSKISVQTDFQKEYSGTDVLLNAEEGLIGYNLDVVKKMARGLGIHDIVNAGGGRLAVVEFGAGTGALAEVWRHLFNFDPICVEIDPNLIQILQSKGFKTADDISKLASKTPLLYTSNVLEHIEDDITALKAIKAKIEPGGKLAIYVPALPLLFSDLDRKVGHFRRYRKKELIRKVKLAGFEVQNCYFNDSIGVAASLILKIVGYKTQKGLGSKKSLVFYDRYAYPVSKALDRLIFKHIIGKNLILFATNPKP